MQQPNDWYYTYIRTKEGCYLLLSNKNGDIRNLNENEREKFIQEWQNGTPFISSVITKLEKTIITLIPTTAKNPYTTTV